MSEHVQTLTTEEATLVQHLATGKKHEEIARLMGISAKTVKRWLLRPHVAAALQTVKEDVATRVRTQIEELSDKAIEALKASLDVEDTPAVRLKAAQLVLDRVAPEIKGDIGQSVQDPLQGKGVSLISPEALQYLDTEQIKTIDAIVQIAEERRLKADNDRETLERKRM
jgi:hypothetical protein